MSHSRSLCVSLGLLSIGASQIPLCIVISVKDSWQPHVQNHHSTFILYREPSSRQMLQRNVRSKIELSQRRYQDPDCGSLGTENG